MEPNEYFNALESRKRGRLLVLFMHSHDTLDPIKDLLHTLWTRNPLSDFRNFTYHEWKVDPETIVRFTHTDSDQTKNIAIFPGERRIEISLDDDDWREVFDFMFARFRAVGVFEALLIPYLYRPEKGLLYKRLVKPRLLMNKNSL